jgi:NADPH:quinone reductase-like Zn-dependent oxidoreductase
MKGIVYREYGSPDVLRYEEVAQPIPSDDQVLLKVRAASVNPFDCHFMRGTPYVMRIQVGLLKPKNTRLGVDVVGQVEAVGATVTQFKPGDEVLGTCRGAFAEYACTSESALVMKPANLTFADAASVPVAALTALKGLRDMGTIQPGQKVLINGASGGVGSFAVQIAKSFDAHVTGICSTRNVDLVRSLGADAVVDYARDDFTSSGQQYDLILDCFANHGLFACLRVLRPRGTYVIVGGPGGRLLGPLVVAIKALVLSPFVSQKMGLIMAKSRKDDLAVVCDLVRSGKVRPVIDRRYKLNEVPEAIRYLETGHARGKVVITVDAAS